MPVHDLEVVAPGRQVAEVALDERQRLRDEVPRLGLAARTPAGEPLLDPHRRDDDIRTVTFGPGGEATLVGQDGEGGVTIHAGGDRNIRYLVARVNYFDRVKRAIVAFPDDDKLREMANALARAL